MHMHNHDNVCLARAAHMLMMLQAPKGAKGVDSTASSREAQDTAIALATHYKCVVVVSGAEDIITDGT